MSDRRGAVVIGGGFYGAAIAAYLARRLRPARVLLVEREGALLQRASYNNQARVHNGYHYPRSFTTAFRSRINLPRFSSDYSACVRRDFEKIYAIARRNSKVTAKQFERFCRDIGADLRPVPAPLRRMFEPRLIEACYLVDEYAFDSRLLAQRMREELDQEGVEILLATEAAAIRKKGDTLVVSCIGGDGSSCDLESTYVFNCTYARLNYLGGDFPRVSAGLRQEITEMGLMKLPSPLMDVGVTVMDGPFFSMMPFPSRALHTVSHVRYTPHLAWADAAAIDPYRRLAEYPKESRVDRMMRDVARYIPGIAGAHQEASLFEVKTVLAKNEGDDGRPILFERHSALPGCYSVLGGKIDNIYDIVDKLDAEKLETGPCRSTLNG